MKTTMAMMGLAVALTWLPAQAQRLPNTTLRMPPALPPEGTNAYVTTNAFGSLAFSSPIALAAAPGESNRLYVVERGGLIQVITNLNSPTKTEFLNITNRVLLGGERGLLGLAFHPQYASNRYFYVFYTRSPNGSNCVSRFRAVAGNPNAADPASETMLLSQVDEASNHNGGDVHFGPDGYLYVSLGDEGGGNDAYNNAQRIDRDFFSGLLRLDVDQRPGSLAPNPHPAVVAPAAYAIPPDNPFIGATNFNGQTVTAANVRTEFYAVGLRNPWRFSFDPLTGDLLCGDVGQDAWEEVDLIRLGGNYGWAYREGFAAGPKAAPPGAGPFAAPLLVYYQPPTESRSITGGLVYRGNNLPELVGRYVFADYVTGDLWAMTHDGVATTSLVRLGFDNNIVAFGADPRHGDVLLCDLGANQVKRLVRAAASTNVLPATLADTGVFSNLTALAANPGIEPYDLNVPFWSDGAQKRRWFSVPNTNLQVTFAADVPWTFPTGTVWVKHFDLELTSGVPSSVRRLETRLLVKNSTADGGYGVTYRWGTSVTNAALVGGAGLDELFLVQEGATVRTQLWRYPSRGECLVCHNAAAGFALGFSSAQLNREVVRDSAPTNQVAWMRASGYIGNDLGSVHLLRRLARADEGAWSLEHRVRSYLEANCAACHLPGGTAQGNFDARSATPLSDAGLIDGPLNNTYGHPSNRVVVRGAVSNSMLHARIAVRGPGQMPPLASRVLDTQAVALVAAWIDGPATNLRTFAEWQAVFFGGPTGAEAQAFADPDGDGAVNRLEWLTGSDPTNRLSSWRIDEIAYAVSGRVEVGFTRAAARGFDVQSASGPADDAAWRPLDTPANAPFFAATSGVARVADPEPPATGRVYRVRVYEP